MTDPWSEFVQRVDDANCAGYIERVDPKDPKHASVQMFLDADAILRLRPEDTVEELESTAREFIGPDRSRMLVGYVGFDAAGIFEPLLHRFPGGSPFPLGELAVVRAMKPTRIAVPPVQALAPALKKRVVPDPITETLGVREFEARVAGLRQSIRDGEAFQVVLSRRRTFRRPRDLPERAAVLRRTERFRTFYYLKFRDRSMVGATPEGVVRYAGHRASIHPIAGTRPLGEPAKGRPALKLDPKELAEHRMLVDLARNDLGRLAKPGTVQIEWTERAEKFARLEHLVSSVSADIPNGVGPFRMLASAFPAGTVCGAPKIRATHLLRSAEASWRGPFGGAIGSIGPDDHTDWALAIRSGFVAGPYLYTAAGAGIVWPSEPRREFTETESKLAHIETVLLGEDTS
ncbi:MAG TPA: chorismate-binding protein [Thermoplasmata archaeon]|nr:chorismate-binding protein [Thermoplasmata archaeon]